MSGIFSVSPISNHTGCIMINNSYFFFYSSLNFGETILSNVMLSTHLLHQWMFISCISIAYLALNEGDKKWRLVLGNICAWQRTYAILIARPINLLINWTTTIYKTYTLSEIGIEIGICVISVV